MISSLLSSPSSYNLLPFPLTQVHLPAHGWICYRPDQGLCFGVAGTSICHLISYVKVRRSLPFIRRELLYIVRQIQSATGTSATSGVASAMRRVGSSSSCSQGRDQVVWYNGSCRMFFVTTINVPGTTPIDAAGAPMRRISARSRPPVVAEEGIIR